jgi:hypothetical protein
VAAVFRGELAASFARIEHRPIALTEAARHRRGELRCVCCVARVDARERARKGYEWVCSIPKNDR